ncbi:MAG: hypothetical protein MR896_00935 [Clostridiales bacterium]|nr:hypothetical protein [Clostridiales bacterium]
MKLSKSNLYLIPLFLGILLILAGIVLQVPSDELTLYQILDGESSVVEEYVGGDAYNFIIGASLVGGRIAGMLAVKAITIVGGILSIGIAVFLYAVSSPAEPKSADAFHDSAPESCYQNEE